MINTQPPEKQVKGGMFLEVNEIFDSIQGEGPFSGHPATFVRLAGCNIQCTWCDTKYTDRKSMSIHDIVGLCVGNERNLVVLTGGEPMRQEIAPLINLLEQKGHLVQIETNGILWSPGVEDTGAYIVCSPKTSKVHANIYILKNTTNRVFIKLVVGEGAYPTQPNDKGGAVIPFHKADYVLPLDSGDNYQNKENYGIAIKYAREHEHTVLQTQIHKQLGVR